LTESLISFTITSITNHGKQILGFTVAKKTEWERKWKEKKKFLDIKMQEARVSTMLLTDKSSS
jgi:hypothetical protein